MSRSNQHKVREMADDDTPSGIVPAGTPSWITQELIHETIRIWQPYYELAITVEDAIEIISSAARLFEAFSITNQSRISQETMACYLPD